MSIAFGSKLMIPHQLRPLRHDADVEIFSAVRIEPLKSTETSLEVIKFDSVLANIGLAFKWNSVLKPSASDKPSYFWLAVAAALGENEMIYLDLVKLVPDDSANSNNDELPVRYASSLGGTYWLTDIVTMKSGDEIYLKAGSLTNIQQNNTTEILAMFGFSIDTIFNPFHVIKVAADVNGGQLVAYFDNERFNANFNGQESYGVLEFSYDFVVNQTGIYVFSISVLCNYVAGNARCQCDVKKLPLLEYRTESPGYGDEQISGVFIRFYTVHERITVKSYGKQHSLQAVLISPRYTKPVVWAIHETTSSINVNVNIGDAVDPSSNVTVIIPLTGVYFMALSVHLQSFFVPGKLEVRCNGSKIVMQCSFGVPLEISFRSVHKSSIVPLKVNDTLTFFVSTRNHNSNHNRQSHYQFAGFLLYPDIGNS